MAGSDVTSSELRNKVSLSALPATNCPVTVAAQSIAVASRADSDDARWVELPFHCLTRRKRRKPARESAAVPARRMGLGSFGGHVDEGPEDIFPLIYSELRKVAGRYSVASERTTPPADSPGQRSVAETGEPARQRVAGPDPWARARGAGHAPVAGRPWPSSEAAETRRWRGGAAARRAGQGRDDWRGARGGSPDARSGAHTTRKASIRGLRKWCRFDSFRAVGA